MTLQQGTPYSRATRGLTLNPIARATRGLLITTAVIIIIPVRGRLKGKVELVRKRITVARK